MGLGLGLGLGMGLGLGLEHGPLASERGVERELEPYVIVSGS